MNANRKIDFSKLLGFQVLGEELSRSVSISRMRPSAEGWAKVGDKTCSLLDLPPESDSTHH